jgi:hypothetical protein
VNQPIEHFGSDEIRLTALATESYKVGLSGLLKAPEIAGHEMNLDRLGTGVKVLPRLAPKTGARTWGTRLGRLVGSKCPEETHGLQIESPVGVISPLKMVKDCPPQSERLIFKIAT